jgi:hypothetical protein
METNRIPRKIFPDNLVDTYIELQFSTDWNKDYLEKQVTQNLDWDKVPMQSPTGKELYFFTDGLMRFYVSDKRIGTNCVGSYMGWTKYYANIKRILAPIKDKVTFNSVKLNYISHWPETEIFEHLDGEFPLALDNHVRFI